MYDHAQSPRLGQRTAVENPGVMLCTLETLPEVAYRGQIVYRLDDDALQVYDGVAWQIGGSGGSGQIFVQNTAPVADAIGDQWLNTSNYALYVWDGTDWQQVVSDRQQLTTNASLKLAIAVGKVVPIGSTANISVFYQVTQPVVAFVNDFWCQTTNNTVFRYDGVSWNELMDPLITGPINDAGLERSIPDLKIDLFYDTVAPTGLGPEDIGDIWTVTNMSNLVRGWTGAIWVDLQITEDAIVDGAITEDKIAPDAVNGGYHIIDQSIITANLSDNVITEDQMSDYSVPVSKMLTTNHLIY